jgi:CheY-like chemotaxis protein
VILVVDDEAAVRETVQDMLSAQGYQVIVAADGYEAIRILNDRPADLLFTDVVMPGMNGFELARQARLIRPSLRIMYTSAYSYQADGFRGAHDTLMRKPYREAELLSEVSRALTA